MTNTTTVPPYTSGFLGLNADTIQIWLNARCLGAINFAYQSTRLPLKLQHFKTGFYVLEKTCPELDKFIAVKVFENDL